MEPKQNTTSRETNLSMIVDLKTKKRRIRSDDSKPSKTFCQPQLQNQALQKNKNYFEGDFKDILKLLDEKQVLEEKGVFLKDKIPFNDFLEKKIMKKGGFSKEVILYKFKSFSCVCKVVKAKNFQKNEVKHLCQLSDFDICQLYGLVRTANEYHIFMEYCGMNLYEMAMKVQFENEVIIYITEQLCRAVEFAHSKKILHLDIKPSNICLLFTDKGMKPKLTDWGSSKPDDSSKEIRNLTVRYASPEILYWGICKELEVMSHQTNNEAQINKAMSLAQSFLRKYHNIESISTYADCFSIGLTIMFLKDQKHLYGDLTTMNILEMFAENPNAAIDLLPSSSNILISIVQNLVKGDSRFRFSVKEVQEKILNEYNNNYSSSQSALHLKYPSADVPSPQNGPLNIPNLDMLF